MARFISPPPTTVEGFERFIAWTLRQRAAGTYACFAVTVAGRTRQSAFSRCAKRNPDSTPPNGVLHSDRHSGDWASSRKAPSSSCKFAFETLGVHRLEARAALRNGRGNGALRKIGAVQEGVLRKSFLRNGEYLDQALYAIVDEDWRAASSVWRAQSVVVH